MTTTPWGEAEGIRSRKLSPGPGRSREKVQAIQRERILAATVAAVAEKGYEPTRVADILDLAGVSRNAFYKQFTSKHDCFVATLTAITEFAEPTVLSIFDTTPGPWDTKLGAMLDALAEVIVAQPAMARIGWIEAYAAGPDGVRQVERVDRAVEDIVCRALADSPERAGMPREIVRAVVGGVRKIVHSRLREGRADELPGVMPKLFAWMQSYETPPERLRRPRKVPRVLVAETTPAVAPCDRILVAITEIVAEKGYGELAITEIAQRAAISLTTFYSCFDGKEEAFVAAIERWRTRSVEVATPAYLSGEDWPRSVATGLHALLGLMSTEPAVGRLGGVSAYEGGPRALEARDAGVEDMHVFLDEGYRLYPATPSVTREAIGATVYALMSNQIRRRGSEHVYEIAPTAVFVTLAPFIGSDAAAEIANEPLEVAARAVA